MIYLPYLDKNTKNGSYTAILPGVHLSELEGRGNEYIYNGIWQYNGTDNGAIGTANITKHISLPFKELTDQDMVNNVCKFNSIEALKMSFLASSNFDERMIVTYIEFDYTKF